MASAQLNSGRFTAEIDGDFVVFLIGARINRKRHLPKALKAINGMGEMLKHLQAQPEKGLLGFERAGFTTIQYWRSFEHLEAFAKDKDAPHLEAWRRYVKLCSKTGEAGVWHETYQVRAGEYECVYVNVPTRGLAAASTLVPVTAARDGAAQRIRAGAGAAAG
jgi:hypothetical protein